MMIGFITSMVRPGSGVKHMHKTLSWSEECWQRYERITGRQRPEMFRPKGDEDEAGGQVKLPTAAFRLPKREEKEEGGQAKPHLDMFQAPNGTGEKGATLREGQSTRGTEY